MFVIPATPKAEAGGLSLKPAQAKVVRPCLRKQNKNKRFRGIVQVAQQLPSMYKAISSRLDTK
jgi:sulfur transfer protein SufE